MFRFLTWALEALDLSLLSYRLCHFKSITKSTPASVLHCRTKLKQSYKSYIKVLNYHNTMNPKTTLVIVALVATVGILVLNPTSSIAKAGSTCSAQAQTNEKSGQHTVGPITASSSGGSCSISVSSRAGQGSPHIAGSDAFNDPGFRTGTCTSSSAGPSGTTSAFNDGQHSSDRSCSIHSP